MEIFLNFMTYFSSVNQFWRVGFSGLLPVAPCLAFGGRVMI